MDRIWLKQYPPEVPESIDSDEYTSLIDVLEQSVTRYRLQPAFVSMGSTMTYGELDKLSDQLAGFLQHAGLHKGDRVAVMMPNLMQYPVAVFGILRAGMVVVNVNPLYTARELEHQLKDSGARAIIILENFADTLQEIIDNTDIDTVITTQLGDLLDFPRNHIVNLVTKHIRKLVPRWHIDGSTPFPRALKQAADTPSQPVAVQQSDLAFLQYTGGTTGVSKGAQLTHGNIVANLCQVKAWISGTLQEGRETVVTALPMYHIFALTANCLVFLALGGKNLLIANPRDLPGMVEELRAQDFTVLTGVNTLFNGLLNEPSFADLNFRRLKLTLGGGAAVQRKVAEEWKATTGKVLSEAYGLTETSPAASMNPPNAEDWTGSIGLPLSSTEFSLRDEDGNEVGIGEPGELCIKGPQVMAGYWNMPEESATVFTDDGFLKTGDIATVDEQGFFRIVDRKKDMIIVSGFNVFPNEIEDAVARVPGVLECACIGVPDEKTGEAVKVYVVKSDPDLTSEKVIDHSREELTGYKVPRQIVFIDELPKSPVGKILRKELR